MKKKDTESTQTYNAIYRTLINYIHILLYTENTHTYMTYIRLD